MTREQLRLDLVYGAEAIAQFLGLTRRQVYHLASRGHLPTFKLGGTVCGRRSTLLAWIRLQEKTARSWRDQ